MRRFRTPVRNPPNPLNPAGGTEPGRRSLAARLDLYKVHPLIHRLRPYRISARPSMMQRASWQTLLYWQRLLDTTEVEAEAYVVTDVKSIGEIHSEPRVKV